VNGSKPSDVLAATIIEEGILAHGGEAVRDTYGTIGGSRDTPAFDKFKRDKLGGVAQLVRAAES
jgi:hypothetical protein